MSTTAFILFSALVLLGSIVLGIPARGKRKEKEEPREDFRRWAVFRIHPDRLLCGGGPVIEGLTGGPNLFLQGPPTTKRIRLQDMKGNPRVLIRRRRWFSRSIVTIQLDGRRLAELRTPRGGAGLGELRSKVLDFDLDGDPQALELEFRKGGKLIASVSAEIAPSPGSVGAEILSTLDPMPILAVLAALGLIREAAAPARAIAPEASETAPA